MDKNDWQQIIRGIGLLTQIGIIIIVNMGLGFFLGYLVDNYLGTDMIFKIIGLLIGIFSGFYSNYKLINSLYGDNEKS